MVSSASVFSTAKWLEAQSLLFKAVAVLFGSLILTAGSYITVPMVPVPITMQTFAITVVGAVYGWRLGGLTVLFWLSVFRFSLRVRSAVSPASSARLAATSSPSRSAPCSPAGWLSTVSAAAAL